MRVGETARHEEAVAVSFTQYMRPDGRAKPASVDVPAACAADVAATQEAGLAPEAEVLANGLVSFTLYDPETQSDVVCEVCENGPAVKDALQQLFTRGAELVRSGELQRLRDEAEGVDDDGRDSDS